ncbi:PilZ_2 domain-containing protein [Gammaproteobacteria bacterium]
MAAVPRTYPEGLWYEDILPLTWRTVPVEAGESVRLREYNERVMQALEVLEVLEESPSHESRNEEMLEARLKRIELKLELLLDLVGQVVLNQLSIPERLPIHLAAHALVWECDLPPSEGVTVQVDLYLTPRYPQPLCFVGRVQTIEPLTSGKHRVTIIFAELGEVVQDGLERSLFRHHRRRVARTRQVIV